MLGNCFACDRSAKLKGGLCADCRDVAEVRALRARVARLEGAITEATSGIKGAMSSPDYPEPREVLQRVYSHLRAALAPDAARKEGA